MISMAHLRNLTWTAAAVATLVAGAAHACACVQRDAHGTAGARIIFAGKVERIAEQAGVSRVQFRVLKAYWGPVADTVVFSDRMESSCRAQFEPGTVYLVYGYPQTLPGLQGYTTTRCAPNVPLASAGTQLPELESYVRHAQKNPMEYDFDVP
jgi:hypothetical protein